MIKYYDEFFSESFNRTNLKPIKTAGSNGKPFLFYIDEKFDKFRKSQFFRPYITNGIRLWDRSAVISIHNQQKRKWYQYLGLMRLIKVHPGLEIDDQIKIIQNIKPKVIQGYGSVLNILSSRIIEENVSVPKPSLIFTDSELLLPEMRGNIEKAFNTKVIDIYGTFETDNIAYECRRHEGYHITLDSVIMEFIVNDKPVNPDEEGEIVVTVLNNFAMPFIRYNLHDVGSYSKKPCSCGRTFPLLSGIKGRLNDYMCTPDGTKLSFFNIANFDQLAPNVREYQIIQENYNSFKVFVVPGVKYNNHGENIIVPAIKKYFPDAEICVKIVSAIEREQSGKFKAFKSMVMTFDS